MAVVGITAAPVAAENPSFIIDWDEVYGDAVQLECAVLTVEAIIGTKTIDLRTWCGPEDEKTKSRVTGFTVTGKLSFGDGVATNPLGFYQALAGKFNKLCSYAAVLDHTLPVSTTNLETSGRIWFPEVPSFSVPGPEETIPVNFTMNTFQSPVVADTPAGAVMNHPAGPAV